MTITHQTHTPTHRNTINHHTHR